MIVTDVYDKNRALIETITHSTSCILEAQENASLKYETEQYSLDTHRQDNKKQDNLCKRWTFSSKAPRLKQK
jgi:hypothetical protein